MSRSFKKIPILKVVGPKRKEYNKLIRNTQNQVIRQLINLLDKEDYEIPNPKSIIDDYDYIDYWSLLNDPKYYRK